jgi:hypothetical protein
VGAAEAEQAVQDTAQEVRDRDSGSAAEAWVEAAAPAAEELAPAVPVAQAPVRAADCGSLAAVYPGAVAEAVVEAGLDLVGPEEEDQAAGAGPVEAGPAEVARVQVAGPVEDLGGESDPEEAAVVQVEARAVVGDLVEEVDLAVGVE